MNIKTHLFLVCFVILISSCQNNSDDIDPTDDSSQIDDTTTDDGDVSSFLGEIEWVKTFGGSNEDVASSVVKTLDGGFAVLGHTFSIDGDITDKSTTDSDFWVLRISQEGDIIWSKTYGGTADDKGTSIITTQDGGFAIAGHTRSDDGDVSENAGFHDFWIVKLNASGTILWEKTFGFSGSDQASSIIQTNDGGYFISGFIDVTASGGEGEDGRAVQHGVGEYWGIKIDENGELEWRRFFGGTNNDRSYQVLQTIDNGFMLVGSSESIDFDVSSPNGSYDYWVVKINSSGDLLWEKSFGGSEIENGYSATATSDGSFVIVGDTRSSDGDITNPKGNADMWLVKYSSSGSLIWQKSFGGSQFDSARSITEVQDTNLLVVGNSRSNDGDALNNYGQNDGWITLIDKNGDLLFELNVGGSQIDFINDAVETNDNKWLLVGDTESSDIDIILNRGAKDVLIIKIQ